MALPKRFSVRLDNNEIKALIDSATDYLDTAVKYIGAPAVDALEAALAQGVIDFAMVKNLDLSPALIDQAQTYFYLSLAVRQLQADYERLSGQA
jgi:hypothetical protein